MNMTTETNDTDFRRVMDGHNKTMQGLIDRAADLALKHRCGLASFGAALHAFRDAALFADEGPGDPLNADQWEAIESVRRMLPDWATR